MIVLQHLKKQNEISGRGDRWGYVQLVGSYLFSYLLKRPPLLRSVGKKGYRSQRKLLYTVVTGGYDQLNEIPAGLTSSEGWDFICVTDNPKLSSETWEIKLAANDDGLDSVRLSRLYKIQNNLVDSAYDISIYIDANIRIRGNLDCFLTQALPSDRNLGLLFHPFHCSLEQEVELCIRTGRDDPELLEKQYASYTQIEKFGDPYPHINARLLIRRQGDQQIQHLMETWFSQLTLWSRRDQVSFNYSLSQNPQVSPCYIPYWLFRNHFKKLDHL
ncbi:MAG: hypothetical protein ACR2PB_01510 [Desulfocapsaceae bacterium]